LLSAKNPIHWPSGEKNGCTALVVPVSSVAASLLADPNDRRHRGRQQPDLLTGWCVAGLLGRDATAQRADRMWIATIGLDRFRPSLRGVNGSTTTRSCLRASAPGCFRSRPQVASRVRWSRRIAVDRSLPLLGRSRYPAAVTCCSRSSPTRLPPPTMGRSCSRGGG
jgi:hypothetical protein